MTGISKPLHRLRDRYDVVVVGSGYGGSIAASRLARAGHSVCLLERGKEILPGDYPDTGPEAVREFQVDLPGHHIGPATGLYDFRVNPEINVLVGCGLGGTSLINANVSLRAEPRVFDDPRWPRALTDDLGAGVEEGYRRAQQMLRPVPYPEDGPPLPKLRALEKSASALGQRFYRPPINVTFADGVNHVGVEQRACVLCGDCVSGCNYRAKNTTLMNYLPDAANHGAEIFTQAAVHHLERIRDGWLVHFDVPESGRESFGAPAMFVRAGIVVLGAGTLGSTEILLRSRAAGLPLSDRVGFGFTGNGDVIGFGYNNDERIDGIGWGNTPAARAHPVGPCITGIVDLRERPELEEGMVIEEGSIPGALGFFLPQAFAVLSRAVGSDTDEGAADWWRERRREAASLLGGSGRGALRNTQVYLVMTHDDAGGRMYLDDRGRVRVSWPGVGEQPVFAEVNRNLEAATKALGGTYVPNPVWTDLLGHDLVTVHPLGGCVMAEDAERGVTDHLGRVFADRHGDAVHDGLYVMDGSVMPRSLGVNPLLTISAVAERNVALLAADRGWPIDLEFPPVEPRPQERLPVGVQFTESMVGFVSATATGDHEEAAVQGEREGSPFEFVLTITADDVDRLIAEPAYEAHMVGSVVAPALSDRPLTVTGGRFNLFVDEQAQPRVKRMRYEMPMTAVDGRRLWFSGFKQIRDDPGVDLWEDTTTLFVTIAEGDTAEGAPLARGILRIAPPDFMRQLTTMRAVNASTLSERLGALVKFGREFAGNLLEAYGGEEKLLRNAGA